MRANATDTEGRKAVLKKRIQDGVSEAAKLNANETMGWIHETCEQLDTEKQEAANEFEY